MSDLYEPTRGRETASAGATLESGSGKSNLSYLVPSYEPGKDDLLTWSQKIELLTSAWPENKVPELMARIILGCSGSAFQKLQLHQTELLKEGKAGVKRAVELLGGYWGRIPLERRYENAGKALFRCVQRADETNDSYLARADIVWSELLTKGTTLEEIQSYVVLRGSSLSGEDKKRVVLECDASGKGNLDMKRVSSAIRMLGAGFFHEVTTGKKVSKQKTYDNTAFMLEDHETEEGEHTLNVWTEENEDEAFEVLLSEGDEDAVFIADFEGAATEALQADAELAQAYNAYADARRRLSEKARHRGFWPTSKGQGSNKGKGFRRESGGKGKGKGFQRKSLQQRILSSHCRLCGQKGHWRAECPQRSTQMASAAASTSAPSTSQSSFTGLATVETQGDHLPLEFLELPSIEKTLDDAPGLISHIFVVGVLNSHRERMRQQMHAWGFHTSGGNTSASSRSAAKSILPSQCRSEIEPEIDSVRDRESQSPASTIGMPPAVTLAVQASGPDTSWFEHGPVGILDTGATKTVIGSQLLPAFMKALSPNLRQQISRSECKVTFRFGNQGTLQSSVAVVIPLGQLLLRVAIVPGGTPFLLSNTLVRRLKATIDTEHNQITSPYLSEAVPLTMTNRGLYFLNVDTLATMMKKGRTLLGTTFHAETLESHEKSRCAKPIDHDTQQASSPLGKSVSGDCKAQAHSTHDGFGGQARTLGDQVRRGRSGWEHSDVTRQHPGGHRQDLQPVDTGRGLEHAAGVDAPDAEELPRQHEHPASPPAPICRAQADGSRSSTGLGPGLSGPISSPQSDAHGVQEHGTDSQGTSNQGAHGEDGARQRGSVDRATEERDTSGWSGDSDASPHQPHGRDRESPRTDCEPPPTTCPGHCQVTGPEGCLEVLGTNTCHIETNMHYAACAPGDVDGDDEDEVYYQLAGHEPSKDRTSLQALIEKFEHELEVTRQQVRPSGSREFLFEVFAGPNSQLTSQCHRRNMTARRYGLPECNLESSDGRQTLFSDLIRHQPRHVWLAPVCRPWSAWSNLNGARSLRAFDELQKTRHDMLGQIALGIVVTRHQLHQGRHAHWEQPSSSLMLRLPGLREIRQNTMPATFDMCRVGELRDPETGRPMRKRTTVLTTLPVLHEFLDRRYRQGQHEHQSLEGSIQVNQQQVSRTSFAEHYTRKFARQVVQILHSFKGASQRSVRQCDMALTTRVHDPEPEVPAPKRFKAAGPPGGQKRPTDGLSRVTVPGDVEKRRRLIGKQVPPSGSLGEWTQLLRDISAMTPRVGKQQITDAQICQELQRLMPDRAIRAIVACRGTDRTLGPPSCISGPEAPWRRSVMVRRSDGEVLVEHEWEHWHDLPKYRVIRKHHACRLNVTVFGAEHEQGHPERSEQGVRDQQAESESPAADTPTVETSMTLPPGISQDRVQSEITDVRHGKSFLQLGPHEKQTIAKLHKNMGHPNPEKLAGLLRQQGYPLHVVKGAMEYQCSSCCETQNPKIARPSTIREALDFNDRIAMDAFVFSSAQGQRHQVYHIVDYATSFQTAFVAPRASSEDVIEGMMRAWFAWAGAPGSLHVDAGSELVSEEVMTFLQAHNVQCITCAPRAHWQNGRAERHGAIIQDMLRRYDRETAISTYADMQHALWQVCQAKNALSVRKGYSPEMLVLGKAIKMPGSVTSDDLPTAHLLAENDTGHGIRFRDMLFRREVARRAFHAADNSAALRRALLRRSRPPRQQYSPGEWMIFKSSPLGTSQGSWVGPSQVITCSQDQGVWAQLGNKLHRVALEHCRPVSSMEARQVDPRSPTPSDCETVQRSPQLAEIPEEDTPVRQSIGAPTQKTSESQSQPDQEPSSASEPVEATPVTDGVNVPVPGSDTEEGLWSATFWSDDVVDFRDPHKHMAWRFEVDLSNQDIQRWRLESNPEDMAFIAAPAKKQRSEVRMTELSPEEQELFRQAQASEINNWVKHKAVEKVLRSQIDPSQVLRARWILTWKPIDPTEIGSDGRTHKPKARLVVLGYLDPNLENIPRDSPTMTKSSRTLILQLIASRCWTLRSFDIKAAFLQGQPQADRVMGLEPVPEMVPALGLRENQILRLVKGAYGLVDAPFLWFKALTGELKRLGFQEAPWDPCVWILRDPKTHAPHGILGIHVDDGLCGGDQVFSDAVDQLEKTFAFGSKKSQAFTFTGIELSQRPDGGIVLSQSAYVRGISSIVVSQERRLQADHQVTDQERGRLRGLIGSLQYAAINTRPDLASRLSHLQSSVPTATVETLLEANRVLHEAKQHHDVNIVIQPIRCEDLRFLAFCDASFASAKTPVSHAGAIILSTHKDISRNQSCIVSPLLWSSKKIQKVVTSTLAAETMSMSATMDQVSWMKLYWSWILDDRTPWRDPKAALAQLPESFTGATDRSEPDVTATDCRSLYDLLTKTAPPNCSEFRTQLHARAIRDLAGEGIRIRWVHTGAQLADGLTKVMNNSFLRETLQLGRYRLADEESVLKARASNRTRLQWLRQAETTQDHLQNSSLKFS